MTAQTNRASLAAAGALAAALAWVPPGTAHARSKEGTPPPAPFYAVTLDEGAEPAAAPAVLPAEVSAEPARRTDTGGDAGAAVLTLFGFLGLIAGNLVRWSGDPSARIDRSVFR